MKIISVVGARPNFMKIAPFIRQIEKFNDKIKNKENTINHILVHTGQHYDDRMSNSFFEELRIPKADINLGVGSGSHAEQVGKTMIEFEKVLVQEKPDWVVVVGDVNATLSCSVTAKKMHVKVCHIEAGLRSRDMNMPEEINRLITDRLSDLLLTPDKIAVDNLLNEGVLKSQIKFVGNIMIDTLEQNKEKASSLQLESVVFNNYYAGQSVNGVNIVKKSFVLMTLHRPSNVDRKEVLEPIIRFLQDIVAKDMKIIWPIHPRTKKQLIDFKLWDEILNNKKILILHPLGYNEMLKLNMNARILLTDSGGLQEESTVLGTPCLTLRWNTERPITLRENGGASVLVGNNISRIRAEYFKTLNQQFVSKRPELWDGNTALRCLNAILDYNKLN